MTTINFLKLSDFSNSIEVDAVIPVDFSSSRLLFWDAHTFKDYDRAVDLSDLIDGTGNNANFYIKAEDVNLKVFSGLFFLEFSEYNTDTNSYEGNTLGLVSNFMEYHECLLNKVLGIDIDHCKKVSFDCDECHKNIYFLSVLIDALGKSISMGFYQEAIHIILKIEGLCDTCSTCPDYGNINIINGLGYGMKDNNIILM